MSRTTNSIKNIKYSFIGQVLNLLASFAMRMVFVRTLSKEYLGLDGLFSNILSILSLAELGVGSAIVYSIYKPLAENDDSKLKGLMNLYKKAYISIGILILIIGIALTPFLGYFIIDMPNIAYINMIYIIYVFNSASTYFFSYKRSFLIADQKKYIDSYYHYLFYFMRIIIQIILLLFTKNFLLYLGIQVLSTLIENTTISNKIDKLYPFLKGKGNEKISQDEKRTIIRNAKAMMFHKLGSVIVMGTDNLLISKFVGLIEVGLYSNYILITSALNQIFSTLFQSMTASIGNLGVTESNEKNIFVFNCIDFFGFWIYAFATICLIILFNPFINLWLGGDYLFSNDIILLIVINFYLTGRRKSVLTFRDAQGLFWYDRYKPLLESIINLIASIILVNFMGIKGVILGTIVSTLATCFWIEPYVLYKYGFKSSAKKYFIKYIIWTFIFIVVGYITWIISSAISDYTILGFTMKIILCATIPNMMFLIIFWKSREFQYLFNILKLVCTNKLNLKGY